MDEVNISYPRASLDRLIEGRVWKGLNRRSDWIEVDGSWADIRSRTELTGDVESEAWLEVLDLDNAIASLKGKHPPAAAVVCLTLFGFDRSDATFIRNYDRLLERGKAYLQAYLAGEDPDEAYRRGYRRGAA